MKGMLRYAAKQIKRNFCITLAIGTLFMILCRAQEFWSIAMVSCIGCCCFASITVLQFVCCILSCFVPVLRWPVRLRESQLKFCKFNDGILSEGSSRTEVIGRCMLVWHIPFMKLFVEEAYEENQE